VHTKDIKQSIAQLLDAPLRNPRLLSRLSRDRLDPVSRTIPRNPRNGQTEDKSRAAHILKRLGHISVNPSDPVNTQAITGSYAYHNPTSAATQIEEVQYLNENQAITEAFVMMLIDEAAHQHFIATQLKSGVPEAVNASRRMFVLHGSRGIGKTFFLNFALSKWSNVLDESKTVWVRVDLVKNFPPRNDLLKWIYAQTTKILLRYYDSRSKLYQKRSLDIASLPLDQEIQRYIAGLPEEVRRTETDAWIRMTEVFRRDVTEQPLSELLVSEHIARRVFQYFIQAGFKFIVILDGFDRLEATHDMSNKFHSLVQNVLDLGKSTEPIGFPIVVVMRTNTLRSLSAGSAYRRFPTTHQFSLGTPELTEIIQKRIAYLTDEIGRIAATNGWDTADWPAHLTQFLDFLKNSEEHRNYLETLSNMFGINRRAQLQVLQLAYFDYIGYLQEKKRIGERQYRLTEAMCKVGYRYPPRHYRYTNKRGRIDRDLGDDLGFDNRFLPSLFAYPVVENPIENDFNYGDFDFLLFLRVLQFVKSHHTASVGADDSLELAVFEVANMMHWMFGYDAELVKKLIGELIEFEVIYAYGQFDDFETDLNNLRIGGLPKLNYILDRYLNDIAYLALSLMRAPIGPFQLHDDSATTFVEISHTEVGSELSHWISTKCLNAVSAYRVMRELNKLQRAIFKENVESIEGKKRRYPQLLERFAASRPFDFDVSMRQHVGEELEALLLTPVWSGGRETAPVEIPSVVRAVESYKQLW
jgi:hypothetical protein